MGSIDKIDVKQINFLKIIQESQQSNSEFKNIESYDILKKDI